MPKALAVQVGVEKTEPIMRNETNVMKQGVLRVSFWVVF